MPLKFGYHAIGLFHAEGFSAGSEGGGMLQQLMVLEVLEVLVLVQGAAGARATGATAAGARSTGAAAAGASVFGFPLDVRDISIIIIRLLMLKFPLLILPDL